MPSVAFFSELLALQTGHRRLSEQIKAFRRDSLVIENSPFLALYIEASPLANYMPDSHRPGLYGLALCHYSYESEIAHSDPEMIFALKEAASGELGFVEALSFRNDYLDLNLRAYHPGLEGWRRNDPVATNLARYAQRWAHDLTERGYLNKLR